MSKYIAQIALISFDHGRLIFDKSIVFCVIVFLIVFMQKWIGRDD